VAPTYNSSTPEEEVEDFKFKFSLCYTARSYIKKPHKTKQMDR
jgi:hypothetical protein